MEKCWIVMQHVDNWEGGYSSSSVGVYSSYEKAQKVANVLEAISEMDESYDIDEVEVDTINDCLKSFLRDKIDACEKLSPLLEDAKGLL